MALAFIMALSLLVYSLGQRKLRMALQQAEASVPNQKGSRLLDRLYDGFFRVFNRFM